MSKWLHTEGKWCYPEGLNRLERWGCVNILVFNRSRCKVLHWVGAIPSTTTGCNEKGLRAALWRRTWDCWWMGTLTWTARCTCNPESQSYLRLHQEKSGQQVEGGDSPLFFHSCDILPGVLHSALGPVT